MHELCGAATLRDELEEIWPHPVHPTQGAKKKERWRRSALSRPRAPPHERDDLSFRGPPEMRAERKIDVHDRVRTSHPSIDHRPGSEPVDDPRVARCPAFEDGCDLVERGSSPAGQPLHLVDLVNRNAEMSAERARKGGLAAASIADDRDASHQTIVTRKRERGPPPSRGRRTSLERVLVRRRCCYLVRFASTESFACLAIRNFSTRFAGIEIG
jgi:hypothetical protein